MTRRVNFSSQQRVDQPDALAIGTFATMDARRILRQTLMGTDANQGVDKGRIIRGFAVEAEDPGVGPRVLVRMQLATGVYSGAMAAINSGAGTLDWGQIAGGADGLGNLEGSAQNLLDFTSQPPGDFDVKLRAVFGPGLKRNRAFWNPASNAEFIQLTPTRLLPQWEIAFQNHTDPEWVTLGRVAWDGVSIAAADITDLREFPLEGTPKPVQLFVDQWSFPAQTGDADNFGVGNFDRGDDRGTVQFPGVWAATRALARQIQDIKGGRDKDLRYDWFSLPASAPGFYADNNNIGTTRTMRMLDTVTFTCADGITDHGDFNGLDSIFNCFKFIADNPTLTPNRITILVKTRSVDSPTFTWSDQISIGGDKSITLVAIGGGAPSSDPILDLPQGTAIIIGDTLVSGSMLNFTGSAIGSLHVENITWVSVLDTVGIISMNQESSFSMKNSTLTSPTFTDDLTTVTPTLRCPNTSLVIEDSLLVGLIYIGGKETAPGAPIPEERDLNWTYGRIINTRIFGHTRFRYDDPDGTDEDDAWFYANNISVEGCTFITVVSNNNSFATVAMVDLAGCRNMRFEQCNFQYAGDETAIRVKSGPVVFGTRWSTPEHITFDDCFFKLSNDSAHPGFQTGAGGAGGTFGTGWAIRLYGEELGGPDPLVGPDQLPRHIRVEGCRFDAGFNPLTSLDIVSPADAGYISATDTRFSHFSKNRFVNWTTPLPAQNLDTQRLVLFSATTLGATIEGNSDNFFNDNFIGDWHSSGNGAGRWGDGNMNAFMVSVADRIQVRGNVISAFRRGSSFIPDLTQALPTAMLVQSTLNADISYNQFVGWRVSATPLDNICVGFLSANVGVDFSHNKFVECGGNNIVATAAATLLDCSFTANRFLVGQDTSKFSSCIDFTTLGAGGDFITYVGNSWDYQGAHIGVQDPACVRIDTLFGMFSANQFSNGDAFHPTGTGPFAFFVGWNSTERLSLVFDYIT